MAAERYRDRYSPGSEEPHSRPPNAFRNRRAERPDWRTTLLFFAPMPLLFRALGDIRQGDATGMVLSLAALAVLLLAAWLLRDGQKAQADYDARQIARPPAIPRKIFASVLSGLGVAIAAVGGSMFGLFPAIALGVVAALAHSFSFGIDPMRKKGLTGVDEFETDRVARAVEEAEQLLKQTHDAALRIGDRGLEARVERLCASAREVLRSVEKDPRDLSRSRKFMSVYLMGARDATAKFADVYSRSRSAEARRDYEALLGDLEQSFAAQRDILLVEDRTDLDIEIEVLRERLQREGILRS